MSFSAFFLKAYWPYFGRGFVLIRDQCQHQLPTACSSLAAQNGKWKRSHTSRGWYYTIETVKKETRGLQLAASGYHDVLQLRSPGNLVTSFPKGSTVARLFELLIFVGVIMSHIRVIYLMDIDFDKRDARTFVRNIFSSLSYKSAQRSRT